MLSDVVIEVADEVVNDLNAQLFSVQFTALRVYLPDMRLAELSELPVVFVAPRDVSREAISREKVQEQWGLDIGVTAKVIDKTPYHIDPLFVLMNEIALRYSNYVTLAGRGVSFDPAVEPIFDPQKLNEQHVFQSVLQTTFTLMR